jgi:hypothetical protein
MVRDESGKWVRSTKQASLAAEEEEGEEEKDEEEEGEAGADNTPTPSPLHLLQQTLHSVRAINRRLTARIQTLEARKNTIVAISGRDHTERVQLRLDHDALVEQNAVLQRSQRALLRALHASSARLRELGQEPGRRFVLGSGAAAAGGGGRGRGRKRKFGDGL